MLFGVGIVGRIGRPGSPAPSKGGGAFSLAAFMAGQSDGLWHNFLRTDRQYQEAVGPTLADDPNEVIGLSLSQRLSAGQSLTQVLAAATELVVNGGFDVDANWNPGGVAGGNTAVISGGKLTISSLDGTNVQRTQGVPAVAGRTYCIEFFIDSVSAGSWAIGVAGVTIGAGTALGLTRLFYTADTNAISLDIKRGGGVTTYVMDRISVKEVSRYSAVQATTAAKPKYQTTGAAFDGTDDNLLTNYFAGSGANFIVAKVTVPASIPSLQSIMGAQDTNRCRLDLTTTGRLSGALGPSGFIGSGADLRGRTVVVGMSWDGTTVRLFSDGALVYEAAQPGATTTTMPFRIGAVNANNSAAQFFGGSIEEPLAGRQFLDLATFNQIASQL